MEASSCPREVMDDRLGESADSRTKRAMTPTLKPDIRFNLGASRDPVLNAFINDRSRVSSIMGPLGSNKTFGCLQKLMLLSCEQRPCLEGDVDPISGDPIPSRYWNIRPTRWCVVRNTYSDLTTATIKDFIEFFTQPELGRMLMSIPPTFKGQWRLTDKTKVQTEFIFLSLDRPADVKKLRGTQFTGFWWNEVSEADRANVDMADLRHGRYPSIKSAGVGYTWRGMICDTNAMDEDHWYYKYAEEETPGNWKFFKQPGGVYDTGEKHPNGRVVWAPNPEAEGVVNLPDQERYYIDGLEGKDDDWIKVNLANQYGFAVDGKPVHPEYIDDIHCTEFIPDIKDIKVLYLGLDFGRTPAAAIVYRDEVYGRYYVIDELTSINMPASEFGPELKKYLDLNYPGKPVGGHSDPAGSSPGQEVNDSAIDLIAAAGIPCIPAPSNSVTMRRAAVARPLRENAMDGRPRLLVCKKAKMIRKGLMGGFCYRRMQISGSERYHEEPDKNMYSHPVEALEYVLLSIGERVEALKPPPPAGGRRGRRRPPRMAITSKSRKR